MSQERLRVRQVIVVEGRYDAAALEPLVDGLILTTDGFGIFKDKEKQQDIFLHDLYLHLDFMSKHTVSSDRWNQSPFPLVPNCPDHR